MDIKGTVAVITGAASGIGEAVARELAHRRVKALALVDLTPAVENAAAAIEKLHCHKVQVKAFVGSVADTAFRRRVFDEVVAEFGVPRICVPAAGITRDSLAVRRNKETGETMLYPIEDFRQVMEINLVAPTYWALEMVGRIAAERHARGVKRWDPNEHIQGTVVFIGSVSSHGNKGQIAYAATKAGVEGVAATLMTEAIFYGVRCAVIHPGYTDTPMVRALGEEFIRDKVLPYTQLRRLIQPEEIADAICFLISNSAVSGELWADAGWHPSA